MKKLLLLIVGIFLFADVGVLVKKNGFVKIKPAHSIRKKSVNVGYKIQNGDTVYTYDSLAVIKLNDNSTIKLDKFTTIKFLPKNITQKEGRAYYQITHQKIKKLSVNTPYTTIGVKGTVFVVSSQKKDNFVALKKGKISLNSKKGKYAIHKTIKDEFAEYKKNMMDEFNEYKKQLQKEFIEYKKSFDLEAGKMATFDGNNVYEKKINPKLFEYFENEF